MSQLGQAISLLEQAIGKVELIAQEQEAQDDLFAQNQQNHDSMVDGGYQGQDSKFADDVKDDLGDVQSISPKEFRDRLNGVIIKMEALINEDS